MARFSSTSAYAVIVVLLFACSADQVFGRKCVCTSKVCKESGAKTCRTRFSCYTELIYDAKQPGTTKTTRGCTEGAPPLLCESKTWHAAAASSSDEESRGNSLEQLGRAPWPRLSCCDSHDYCNAADEDFEPSASSARPINAERIVIDARDQLADAQEPGASGNAGRDYRSATVTISGSALAGHQSLQPLHLAALVLAVAALISVFAACYVVTRFLPTTPEDELPPKSSCPLFPRVYAQAPDNYGRLDF